MINATLVDVSIVSTHSSQANHNRNNSHCLGDPLDRKHISALLNYLITIKITASSSSSNNLTINQTIMIFTHFCVDVHL